MKTNQKIAMAMQTTNKPKIASRLISDQDDSEEDD